jgi:hypothetical protein
VAHYVGTNDSGATDAGRDSHLVLCTGCYGAGQLVSETRHIDAATWHTTDFQYD